jgi:hypothetical protein
MMKESKPGPATKYVSRLLLSLCRSDPPEITITESRGLPEFSGFDNAAVRGYAQVRNRLKVMARITPMKYQTPISGQFVFWVDHHEYAAEVEFHDTETDPWLQLRCVSKT